MKNILLIGTGHFGHHIAVQLAQLGHQVMAVDSREDRINEILPFVTSAQIGDATNKEFLRSLGVGNYDVCFVTIQRSKRPNGPRSATLPIMFLIISSSTSSMRSWTWRYPRPGWGKASAHWISAESLA